MYMICTYVYWFPKINTQLRTYKNPKKEPKEKDCNLLKLQCERQAQYTGELEGSEWMNERTVLQKKRRGDVYVRWKR